MTVSDTHADTIRDADAAVALRCALMSSLAVTGPLYTHETYDEGMAALDALVAERDRQREAAANIKRDYDDVFGQLLRSHGERDRERARADRAEAALRGLMDALLIDEDGNLVTPMNGWASAWVEAQAALSAGSGGREPT